MKSGILPGVIRGLGKARIKFDLAYKNKKIKAENLVKFSFLEKINLKDKEFSKSSLFKTLKLFQESHVDESIFWTLLVLINSEESGGICVPIEELKSFILQKNSSLDPEKSWSSYISANNKNSLFLIENDMFYLKHLYNTEVQVCSYLESFFQKNFAKSAKPFDDKALSEEQNSIINELLLNSISFLSGGPGTGKTTMIQSILKFAIENGIKPELIAVLAPTGKAAKRLQESCTSLLEQFEGLEIPRTIHRFLGYNPSTGRFKYNAENLLEEELIIIDEFSMVDIFILKSFLDAYQNKEGNKKIVFVGDPDQLLSVSSGSIFSDFIELNKNTFKLTQSFRQSQEGKEIKLLSTKIQKIASKNEKKLSIENINISKEFNEISSGVHFIETIKDEETVRLSFEWYNKIILLNYSGQILSPYNETKIGVKNINSFLKKGFPNNQNYPVIVNSNLYNLDLFNGENGYLIESKKSFIFMDSGKKEIEISSSHLQYFDLAYAITVHKSQGSEYDHVCFLIPAEIEEPDSLLNIRILYTAITRAKKSVTIIGSLNLFIKAIESLGQKRHSMILKRLSRS